MAGNGSLPKSPGKQIPRRAEGLLVMTSISDPLTAHASASSGHGQSYAACENSGATNPNASPGGLKGARPRDTRRSGIP